MKTKALANYNPNSLAAWFGGLIAVILLLAAITLLPAPVQGAELSTNDVVAGPHRLAAHAAGSGTVHAESLVYVDIPNLVSYYGWDDQREEFELVVRGESNSPLFGDIRVNFNGVSVESLTPTAHYTSGLAQQFGFYGPHANYSFESNLPLLLDMGITPSVTMQVSPQATLTATLDPVHPPTIIIPRGSCPNADGSRTVYVAVYSLGHPVPPAVTITLDGTPFAGALLLAPTPSVNGGEVIRKGVYRWDIPAAGLTQIQIMYLQKQLSGNQEAIAIGVQGAEFTPLPYWTDKSLFSRNDCAGKGSLPGNSSAW